VSGNQLSFERSFKYLFKFCAIGTDNHDVVPDLPVVVVALDSLLKNFPGSGLLTQLDVRVGQIVPGFKILKKIVDYSSP
jgi:hypothetical protein